MIYILQYRRLLPNASPKLTNVTTDDHVPATGSIGKLPNQKQHRSGHNTTCITEDFNLACSDTEILQIYEYTTIKQQNQFSIRQHKQQLLLLIVRYQRTKRSKTPIVASASISHRADSLGPHIAIPYHVIVIALRLSSFHSLSNALRHIQLRVRSCASTTTVTHNVQQREPESYGKSQPVKYHSGQS
jgi:hypothetical protein